MYVVCTDCIVQCMYVVCTVCDIHLRMSMKSLASKDMDYVKIS